MKYGQSRLWLLLLFIPHLVIAQLPVEPAVTLANRLKKEYVNDRARAEIIAKSRNITLRRIEPNGRIAEFYGFDLKGNLLFNITDNVGAGRTISTNKVWPGGVAGTSLTGVLTGDRLGEWDGGAVLTTHQELAGRVVQADGSTSVIDHATHVAGTMIGSGVDANAKGMSYQARLSAYDWFNDVSEMSLAGSNGMLVSNHSYGSITGWHFDGSKYFWYGDTSISTQEDYKFGYYDQFAANWDNVAIQNPYYLICKSAGNDRGENKSGSTWYFPNGSTGIGTVPPADGQYDCIATYSGAKNVLTVGAVSKIGGSNTNNGYTQVSDVVMSSFSSWGPMDDGRLKPDVVGCGVGVYSSVTGTGNKSYASYNGTSMATPNVSGSLLLVQQHHFNLRGQFMKAATLKALVIHTADEAGSNVGPDYKFGWGLVNIAKAVQTLNDSVSSKIQETSLANTKTNSQVISSSGGSPLRITITWMDPAGTPAVPSLDPPNKMLVNDLDIRLTRMSDNTIFYPFVLDKDNPANAATTGDNVVDNVEQIYLAAPQAGNYTLTVKHKGTLVGTQNYSLVITGLMGIPVATFQASTRAVCTNVGTNSVAFTDISGGSPTSRTWYFPGGSPATSTAANPTVSYSTAGKFPVILVVSNALGKDSSYKANYITAGGLTLPFTETFESNSQSLSSWSISNPNNDTTWRLTPIGGTTPGNTAYCMPFFNYTNTGRRDGLITPALSLKGYSAASLTFQHAYARTPAAGSDSLIIYISTNCGSTWTSLLSKGENGANSLRTVADNTNEFFPDSAAKWCFGANSNCITVNLNPYVGQNNIKIKFEGYNNYRNNLYIDNVSINGTALMPIANFYASKKTACVGEAISFFDSTVNISSSWQWTFTGASTPSSTVQNPVGIIYTTPGTYAVKLVVSNSSGADSITKSAYITVVANPSKPTITALRPLNFCEGDSTILSCDSSAASYQWRNGTSKLGGQTAQTLTAYASGGYRVDAVNAFGCSTTSDSLSVRANTYPAKPTITSNLTSGFMCAGGTATLTSSAAAGNQWYRTGVLLNTATAVQYNTQDSGDYTVKASNNGCVSPLSDIKRVDLLPVPITSAIAGTDTSRKNRTDAFSVTNTPGSTYTWTITGGNKVAGGSTNSIQVQWTAAGNGNVKVQENGSNGCKGVAINKPVTVADNTSIAETEGFAKAQIYPNPISTSGYLRVESVIAGAVQLRIYDLPGRMVSDLGLEMKKGNNEFVIQTEALNPGIYFAELTMRGRRMTLKFTVQK